MEAKITSESKELCKEWKSLTCKTFSHVNENLGLKGWLIVGFGIVIVILLGSILAHREDRFERGFSNREFGGRQESMMQGRAGMMGFFGDENQQNDIQGCMQQATVEIDSQNPNGKVYTTHQGNCPFLDSQDNSQENTNSFFGRMENRMKQFFGVDRKGITSTGSAATGATN